MTSASSLFSRRPRTNIARQQVVAARPNPFQLNNGNPICVGYSTETMQQLTECNFNNILEPIPDVTQIGIRKFKRGARLYRGEAEAMDEAYKNFLDEDYLNKWHGLWFASNRAATGVLDSSKYPYVPKYKVIDPMYVLWIPNLSKALKGGMGGQDLKGYDFINQGDGPYNKFVQVWTAKLLDMKKHYEDIKDSLHKAQELRTQIFISITTPSAKRTPEERQTLKDAVQAFKTLGFGGYEDFNPDEVWGKVQASFNIGLSIADISVSDPGKLVIAGYAGCNECEVYIVKAFLKSLESQGAKSRVSKNKYPRSDIQNNPLRSEQHAESEESKDDTAAEQYSNFYGHDASSMRAIGHGFENHPHKGSLSSWYGFDDDASLNGHTMAFDYGDYIVSHRRSKETLSDKYYHDYGSYNHEMPDYALMIAMVSIIFIIACCLVIILSIIGSFITGKFYEMGKKRVTKYKMVDADEASEQMV